MVAVQLQRDEIIGGKWRIVRKLAEGGFGAVYLATDEKTKAECAVKVEPCDPNSVLKVEAHVLMELRGKSAHSCGYLGCGKQGDKMNYLVMTLVGRSLSDLHRARSDRRFQPATVARLMTQCVQGLNDLHDAGFIHRDVKPGNLAIGRTPKDYRIVHVLDFGLARRYTIPEKKSELRLARKSCGFRGTVRYASANVHEGLEQGRHDDLLSLIYVMVEFRSGRLPWADLDEDEDVARMKKRTSPAALLKDLDSDYLDIYSRLNRLTYKDAPDYNAILEQLEEMQKQKNYPTEGAFEWENQ